MKKTSILNILLLTASSIATLFAAEPTKSANEKYSSTSFIDASKSKNSNEKVNQNWSSDYSRMKYVTASSIENLEKNTNSISPKVSPINKMYLYEEGPLGIYGPLGKEGPVQQLKKYTPFLPLALRK